MIGIRLYPKGATHCVFPNDWKDEIFYRKGDETLEVFIMGRHQWFPSNKPLDYLDEIHKLKDPDALRK